MTALLRFLVGTLERLLALPSFIVRLIARGLLFNPRLGPLRYVAAAAVGYVVFALALVYVMAPLRGLIGSHFYAEKLRYDSERWLATAIYDARGHFVGLFDPRLDSQRDVNYTDEAIQIGDYVANPDHKSIPVREVPPHYWACLLYHEDRYLGGWLNPYGIDLLGVLKIPYSSVKRTLATRRPALGVGGSTLPMQFARVIYKTPPSTSEGGLTKLRRKIGEWWLAPVIYHELTRGGDKTPLKKWAANHIWLAQRTGGTPLHGVEVTARIVFGKEAKDLSVAEQFVLASAVNKPIILLEGSDKLNEVRIDRWRYIAEVRAKTCADVLIKDAEEQKKVVFDLVGLAGGPPDPKIKPKLAQALAHHVPSLARRAEANPTIRANSLIPDARYGLREEMKQAWGHGWREYVRGVTTSLDVVDNLAFRDKVREALKEIDTRHQARLSPGFTLDPDKRDATRKLPDVIIVAANARGEIVRYFEAGEGATYFGSPIARDQTSGRYDPSREARMIASTGKMLVAIGLANEGRDTIDSLYLDTEAPERGLESCERGGNLRRGRRALTIFACSMNRPLEWRAAQLGQDRMHRLISGFGFNMPPAAASGEGTPPSTAAVRGLIAGSPRQVHHMAAVVLAALTGGGERVVRPPTLVKTYDYTKREYARAAETAEDGIRPSKLIRPGARPLVKALLQAPLCYSALGQQHGTLKGMSGWCAERRNDLKLHFAKTGTSVTEDPNATIDTWVSGGLQFANGAAYSYVIVVGTGASREVWSHKLHASQVAAPLLETLLADLKDHARRHPAAVASTPAAAPQKPVPRQPAAVAAGKTTPGGSLASDPEMRRQVFERN